MRALAISDTHFGAWTGRDLLREEFALERLAPALEGVDELIFLGDLYDWLFGSLGDAVDASGGLLELIAEQLPGKRLVFLAGNHGHYLDPHARLSGGRGGRLLTRALWGIATGGPEDPKTVADYESVITLLTEWLYVAAQMPHGTHAQQNVFRAGRLESALRAPLRGLRRLRGEQPAPPAGAGDEARAAYPSASVISPSDPSEHALEAFAQVVANLGWAEQTDTVVFAHTHQPLAGVRSARDSRTRYWNTGSWTYEPDRSSRQAYERYLRYAWPGSAVLIDDEEPEPRLLELLADLNPLNGGPGLPPT